MTALRLDAILFNLVCFLPFVVLRYQESCRYLLRISCPSDQLSLAQPRIPPHDTFHWKRKNTNMNSNSSMESTRLDLPKKTKSFDPRRNRTSAEKTSLSRSYVRCVLMIGDDKFQMVIEIMVASNDSAKLMSTLEMGFFGFWIKHARSNGQIIDQSVNIPKK